MADKISDVVSQLFAVTCLKPLWTAEDFYCWSFFYWAMLIVKEFMGYL